MTNVYSYTAQTISSDWSASTCQKYHTKLYNNKKGKNIDSHLHTHKNIFQIRIWKINLLLELTSLTQIFSSCDKNDFPPMSFYKNPAKRWTCDNFLFDYWLKRVIASLCVIKYACLLCQGLCACALRERK